MTDLSPIGAIARRADPDRFLCSVFAPPARREALWTLIAFNHELARAREAASEPVLALMRLTWWREVVEEALAGGTARAHEVAGPVHAAVASGALDGASLIAMAEAREAECEEDGFASEGAFRAYLRGTAGGFAVAVGRALGAPAPLLPALQAAGALFGLAGVLRAVPFHAAQGRCLLPRDRVDAATVLAAPDAADLAVRAMAENAPAAPDLRELPREALAAALPLVLARRDLRRLARGEAVKRGVADRLAVSWAGLRGRI
jgi:phytoene synthase